MNIYSWDFEERGRARGRASYSRDYFLQKIDDMTKALKKINEALKKDILLSKRRAYRKSKLEYVRELERRRRKKQQKRKSV